MLLSLFLVVTAAAFPVVETPFQASTDVVTKELAAEFKYWSEWSASAYCTEQQGPAGSRVACSKTGTKPCPQVESVNSTKIYKTWAERGGTGATGFVATDPSRKAVVLALRGSVSLSNWIADITYQQLECFEYAPKARCETGFYNFWKDCKSGGALDGIKQAMDENPGYRIVVTGHSLGGAAAVLAAGELRKNYSDVTLYTYGQPRVGNLAFSEAISKQGKNYRVTHTNDIVPQLPWEDIHKLLPCPNCDDYVHITPEYWISKGQGNDYTTHRVIHGYKNSTGNTSGNFNLNFVSHLQYYQTNMYSCVMVLDPFLEAFGDKKGTKKYLADASAEDAEWTIQDLQDNGAPEYLTDELRITPPTRGLSKGLY